MKYSQNPNDHNFPLLYFDPDKKVAWTLEDACKGVSIIGQTGSGKSSASGKFFAKSFLKARYGGLVLCAKKDEAKTWVHYAKETGREGDIILFSESNPWRFSFLNYEATRQDRGGGNVRNIVDLLMTVYGISQKQNGQGQRGEDQFWQGALRRLLTRLVMLLILAKEPIKIENFYKLITSAPRDPGAFSDDSWVQSSYCVQCLVKANELASDEPEFALVDSFWSQEFANLDDRTRSIVVESALSIFEPFMSGLLKEMLATESNITPELTHSGKIIILDFPVVSYLELGTLIQSIFKFIWQQAMERRDVDKKPTPCFLFLDEAQLFVSNKEDMLFQTTARSSKCCTIFLTQTINNYYSVMSGTRYKEQTSALLACLATKIVHCSNDSETCKFAADTIGSNFRLVSNFNSSMGLKGASAGAGEQLVHQVLPIEFQSLRTGGTLNTNKVDAILTIAGRPLLGGKNYMKVTFDQRA